MTRQRWSHQKCSPPYVSKNSLKLSVVVVRIFANSPYLPWRSFSLPYLDVTALPEGALAAQFPSEWLCLWCLLLYSQTHVILPCEEEGEKLKVYPILQEALWDSSEERHCLSDPILLMVLSFPIFQLPFSSLQQDDSSQTKEGSSSDTTTMHYLSQSPTQVRASP